MFCRLHVFLSILCFESYYTFIILIRVAIGLIHRISLDFYCDICLQEIRIPGVYIYLYYQNCVVKHRISLIRPSDKAL